ncbi:MlaA family lipoprotein [Vibrio sp. RC27]
MTLKIYRTVLLILVSIATVGCSSRPDSQANGAYDPLESANRVVWTLNYDYLDPYIFRPTAIAYVTYTPTPLRYGLSNFFSNLGEPSTIVNNLLMGNGKKALNHFNRFWLNSTFGLLGVFDIASHAGLSSEGSKGFDDALGHYGVGDGAYLMVPGAGPYTVRNAASFIDNTYLPLSYLNIWGAAGKFLIEGLESRAALVSQESLLESSPDPYAFTRDVYLQREAYNAEIVIDDFDAAEEDEFDNYLDEFGD